MKRTKRILAILLAAVMAISVFPITVSADTTIGVVYVTNVVEPRVGQTADFTCTARTLHLNQLVVTELMWVEMDHAPATFQEVDDADWTYSHSPALTFQANKHYVAVTKVVAALGYSFPSSPVCTVNGRTATFVDKYDSNTLFIYYYFDPAQARALSFSTDHLKGKQATNVYYGTYEEEPVKWRNLQNQNGELYLLSDRVLTRRQYSRAKESVWADSDLRNWLNNDFYVSSFSPLECKAINTQNLVNVDSPYEYGLANVDGGPNTKDNIFILSYSDLGNTKLFYKSDLTAADESRAALDLDGNEKMYWIRTPTRYGEYVWEDKPKNSMVVSSDGRASNDYYYYSNSINNYLGVRPAFYLGTDKVVLTSPAVGGKQSGEVGRDCLQPIHSYTGTDYRLTLYDPARSSFDVREEGFVVSAGVTNTYVLLHYTGAKAGENEYVSAIISDKTTGEALYYGHIAHNSTGGTANLTIPSTLASGKYTLSIISEQINGDYQTDYASRPEVLDLTVADASLIIKSAKATVTPLVAGQTASHGSALVTSGDARYTAKVVAWYVGGLDGELESQISNTSTFRDGMTYYADIRFSRIGGAYKIDPSFTTNITNATEVSKTYESEASVLVRVKVSNLDHDIYTISAESLVPHAGDWVRDDSSSVYVPSSAPYTVRVITWYEVNPTTGAETYMEPGYDSFRAGYTYKLTLGALPKEGYSFAERRSFYINNQKAVNIATNFDGEVWFTIKLKCVPNPDKSITVSGVTPPAIGQTASFSYTYAERDAFADARLSWAELDEHGNFIKGYSEDSDETLVFKEGHRYSASLYIDNGYLEVSYFFTDDSEVTARFNGEAPTDYWTDFNDALIEKDFGVLTDPNKISEIHLTMDTPQVGDSMNVSLSCQTSGCTATLGGWYIDDPLSEMTNLVTNFSSMQFERQRSYIAAIVIQPGAGKTVADDAAVYINGVLAHRTVKIGSLLYFYMVVNPIDAVISSASCTVTAPQIGAHPSEIITVPSGANYTVEFYYWWDCNNWCDLEEDGVFEAGGRYSADLIFIPKDGYELSSDTEYFVNGKKAQFNSSFSDGSAWVWAVFDDFFDATPIDSVAVTGITAPVVGQRQSDEGAVTDTEKCTLYNDLDWYELDEIPTSYHDIFDEAFGSRWLGSNETFQADKYYIVKIPVDPNEGYTFSWETTVTVNGEDATFIYYDIKGDYLHIYHFFGKPSAAEEEITDEEITSVVITDVAAPVVGQTAQCSANTVHSGEIDYVSLVWVEMDTAPTSYSEVDNATWWWANDDSLTFKADKYYVAIAVVGSNSGYVFHEPITATVNGNGATFIDCSQEDTLYIYYVFGKPSAGGGTGSVSGTVTSSGGASDAVTLQLKQGSAVKYTTTATSGSYRFNAVAPGSYTLAVSKKNHVTREYAVTVSSIAVTRDVRITIPGDVNLSGEIDAIDANQVQRYFNGLSSVLTSADGHSDYRLLVANVNNSAEIDTIDANQIQRYFNGLSSVLSNLIKL